MRKLEDQTGVEAPSMDYPSGRVVNEETLISEEINGDIIQFWQYLKRHQSLTENGNPDNMSNGFQMVEIFIGFVTDMMWEDNTFHEVLTGDYGTYFDVVLTSPDDLNLAYRKTRSGYIEFRGMAKPNTGSIPNAQELFTLPSGYRPDTEVRIFGAMGAEVIPFSVSSTGLVRSEVAFTGSDNIVFNCLIPIDA